MAKSISEAPEQLIECQVENPICSPVSATSVSTSFAFQAPKPPMLPPRSVLRCIYQFDPQTKLTLTQFGSLPLALRILFCFFCLFVYVLLLLFLSLSLSLSRCLTNTIDLPPRGCRCCALALAGQQQQQCGPQWPSMGLLAMTWHCRRIGNAKT